MDIQATKIELVKAILEIDNKEIIQKISYYLKKEQVDFWDELTSLQQDEIKKGIEELDNKKRISYESFLKKIS
ncbi:MAG: hypothetical protein PSN34_07420 [Urechidicola sp.]|nr:hypothetical protein [Urechidicola sp.]